MAAAVQAVAARSAGKWLVWGAVDDRPVLFTVDARTGAEMLRAIEMGEAATAIVEPDQLLLEPLD